MKQIHTTALTDQQKREVRELVSRCREYEPITLSAPDEDGPDYYLLYEESEENRKTPAILTGFSFLFFTSTWEDDPENGAATGEFTAFVHPRYRRKGYFTSMLDAALARADDYEAEHGCQVDFCFVTDEKSPAALKVLEAIGAEYWYSEYRMVRPLSAADREYVPRVDIGTAPDREETETAELYTASMDGRTIGTCAVLPSQSGCYLFAFQIREEYRGRGYGKDFLRGMLALLAARCLPEKPDRTSEAAHSVPGQAGKATARTPSVSVQVSGLNYIARNLYKKTGFRNTESLSYYIY